MAADQRKITDLFSTRSEVTTPPVSENEQLQSMQNENTAKQPAAPEKEQPEQSNQSANKKFKKKVFRNEWMSEFSWLNFDIERKTMHCQICQECEKHKAEKDRSAFVKGSKNYQRSALSRHQISDDHVLACKNKKEKVYMKAAIQCVKKKYEPLLEAQLRTALWIARENIADRKFISLIDLQISNAHLFSSTSASASESSGKERPAGIYTNHEAASDFHGYLAAVIREMAIIRIQNSPFIGIMVDESLDIATTKKLVLFCKIIYDGKMKIEFCANIEIADGKAETVYSTIVDWLQSVGVNIRKVSGFGSDGAAVMTGRNSGVGIRLRRDNPRIIHVWCAAHKVALVSFWAAKKIPYLQEIQRILISIYFFYEFSAPRYNKLKELMKIMGEKVRKFKKPTQVRWLSLQDAVEAAHSGWSALVLGLEHEVSQSPNSDGGNTAKGILKQVKSFKFIGTISFLKDVLDCLCKLSRYLQKDVLDIDNVDSMIQATKDTISVMGQVDYESDSVQDLITDIDRSDQYKGVALSCSLRDRSILTNIRRQFVGNLLSEFESRFPPEDQEILKHMNKVLNPGKLPQGRQNIVSHGTDSLESILEYYGDLLDRNRAKTSFLQFKFLVNVNRQKSLTEMCFLLLSDYTEEFPDFCTMAQLLLTVPLTSVPCERGFSLQNRHVSTFTNRRTVKNAENRMLIAFAANGPDFDENEVISRGCNIANS